MGRAGRRRAEERAGHESYPQADHRDYGYDDSHTYGRGVERDGPRPGRRRAEQREDWYDEPPRAMGADPSGDDEDDWLEELRQRPHRRGARRAEEASQGGRRHRDDDEDYWLETSEQGGHYDPSDRGRDDRRHAHHDQHGYGSDDYLPQDHREDRWDAYDASDGYHDDDQDDRPRRRRRYHEDEYDPYDDWDERDEQDRRRKQDPMGMVRTGVRGFGELLITFGLVVLLFAGYEVYGKAAQVNAAQSELDDKLKDAWDKPHNKPLPGDAIARLYLPRLDLKWVVVEGVDPADIKLGPGHFPETAMPGKVGNFSVAGHRMRKIFWDLHLMKPGDQIYLEDDKNWYTYTVTQLKITSPSAVDRVAPVPGKAGAKPTKRILTLMTCNPQWDNYERLFVHAELKQDPLPKSEGSPPQIKNIGK
ncbi:MAG: class E sortase [Micromonosporaceae bacterium]